ncbi:MAG: hypothetical protein EAZ13_07315 [Sphingobacteriia bacterium]|nr:MAG: hypothetical protein EAZ13_07315 [Sphingobacteriia bacterium]
MPYGLKNHIKMKRKIIVFFLIVLITIGITYLLPSKGEEVESTSVEIPLEAVIRTMSDQKKWTGWWSGKVITDSSYELNGASINIEKNLLNGFNAQIINGNLISKIELQFMPISPLETKFTIHLTHQFSSNVFTKATQYIHLLKTKKIKAQLLNSLSAFFSNTKSVYGFAIETQKITQSSLIATKKDLNHYPSVIELYELIHQLKQYIASQNAKAMDEPIMNVFKLDSSNYRLMAAISTDRDLPSTDTYFLKNMVLGNVLVADIIGGQQAIEAGIRALEYYLQDYKKMCPAIPFQRLVTDRSAEKDSSKWITKLYYPIY